MKKTAIIMALIGLFIGHIIADIYLAHERPMPRLIAQGCQGAGGDLWAMEESDFPTNCQNIERY